MLSFYAEHGDVQTGLRSSFFTFHLCRAAVIMSLVLGDRISIPKPRLRQWCLAYIGTVCVWQVTESIEICFTDCNSGMQQMKSFKNPKIFPFDQ
jgi:hypothetical protein